MGLWGLPSEDGGAGGRASRRPAAGGGGAASSGDDAYTVIPLRGFRQAFAALRGRKLSELRGHWAGQDATRAARADIGRRAEAARRAATEMVRRILRLTGRRLSPATIRRHASANARVHGVDPAWIHRQSHIDEAGGIGPFAARLGVTDRVVTQWRDAGRSLRRSPTSVRADVTGFVIVGGRRYEKTMSVAMTLPPGPVADEIRIADTRGDEDLIMDLLGPAVALQYPWQGVADRDFEITEMTEFEVD